MKTAFLVLCFVVIIALAAIGLRMWTAEEQTEPSVNGILVAKNIRVGAQYVFHDRLNYIADYKIHSGWTVMVTSVRLVDHPDSETMYDVKASDGWEGSVYATELSPIP